MATSERERRFVENRSAGVRVSKRENGASVIEGYAAVFYREGDPGTEFALWDDLIERIMPGAFDRAIREGDDVRGLFNHSPSEVLGRSVAKTLRLSVDQIGLRYEIDLPDTQRARDVAVSIERGDISGSSFAFASERIVWVQEEKRMIRQVESVRLFDVGPVTYPAYEGTSTGVRSSDVEVIRREANAFRAERSREADAVALRMREIELGL